MHKILNINIVYNFLLLMLFIGVISNKFGITAYIMIIIFMLLFMFFKLKFDQFNYRTLFIISFGLFILYLSYIYQMYLYDYNNIYYIQFFGSQILFLLLFGFFAEIQQFISKSIGKFLIISISALSLIVLTDYIFMNYDLAYMQMMYREDIPQVYLSKPLGLFAQYSVNSSYAVVFFLLYLSFEEQKKNIIKMILFLLVTLVIILQESGTGFIAYFLLLFIYLSKYKLSRYILFFVVPFLIFFLIKSNLIYRISGDYLFFLYQYFYDIINITYADSVSNSFDVLFGIDGNHSFPIDFGPLFMIAKVGLIYFILYSVYILYMMFKADCIYIKTAIFILLFGNLHYPTLFYPIMNVLLPILFLYITNKKINSNISILNTNKYKRIRVRCIKR